MFYRAIKKNLGKIAIWQIVFIAICIKTPLNAQASPPWTPITGNENNMIAYGNVYRNGVLVSGSGYYVGSYGPGGIVNDCRSVGEVAANGSFFSTIRGNDNGDTIRFMIWDGNTSQAYDASESLSYVADDLRAGFDLHFTVVIPTCTVSGQVTLNGSGLAGVAMNGLPAGTQTNASGNYSATVNSGWSGTVAPALTGYTFTPASRVYTNVTANQTGQSYTATAVVNTYTVSGQVTLNGSGLAGVAMNGLPAGTQTNASGNYSATVNSGWSGTVTPALTGYTFTPANRVYTNVTANQTGQSYTATAVINTFTVSGQVTLNGSGLAGVTMNGLPAGTLTNASGNYSATVNSGWSGTVTPALTGYTFTPANRVYTNVTANQTGQSYTATAVINTFTVSGQVTLNGSGLAGVTMNGLPAGTLTNASGNYSATVNSGWSGTVTPRRIGYIFSPGSMTYNNIQANETMNYTAERRDNRVMFSGGSGGRVTGALEQTVPYSGETSPVTAVPNEGYRFGGWAGSENFSSTDNPLVIWNVTQEMAVNARFNASNDSSGVQITQPLNGSVVNGVVMISVEVDLTIPVSRVDFLIEPIEDPVSQAIYPTANRLPVVASGDLPKFPLRVTTMSMEMGLSGTRYLSEWDTRQSTDGWYKIRAIGIQPVGNDIVDEITVRVENVSLSLQVERRQDRGLRVYRQYAQVNFSITNLGNVEIGRFLLFRNEDNGPFTLVREIMPSELIQSQFNCQDINLDVRVRYRYRIMAVNVNGAVIGRSSTVEI